MRHCLTDDIAIVLATPPEPVAGSTLSAPARQKIALNTISTMAGVLLGHVHDGMMVNLRADNDKLRARAIHRHVDHKGQQTRRKRPLTPAVVKPAILLACGAAGGGGAQAHGQATISGRARDDGVARQANINPP